MGFIESLFGAPEPLSGAAYFQNRTAFDDSPIISELRRKKAFDEINQRVAAGMAPNAAPVAVAPSADIPAPAGNALSPEAFFGKVAPAMMPAGIAMWDAKQQEDMRRRQMATALNNAQDRESAILDFQRRKDQADFEAHNPRAFHVTESFKPATAQGGFGQTTINKTPIFDDTLRRQMAAEGLANQQDARALMMQAANQGFQREMAGERMAADVQARQEEAALRKELLKTQLEGADPARRDREKELRTIHERNIMSRGTSDQTARDSVASLKKMGVPDEIADAMYRQRVSMLYGSTVNPETKEMAPADLYQTLLNTAKSAKPPDAETMNLLITKLDEAGGPQKLSQWIQGRMKSAGMVKPYETQGRSFYPNFAEMRSSPAYGMNVVGAGLRTLLSGNPTVTLPEVDIAAMLLNEMERRKAAQRR